MKKEHIERAKAHLNFVPIGSHFFSHVAFLLYSLVLVIFEPRNTHV